MKTKGSAVGFLLNQQWAMQQDTLMQMLDIAERTHNAKDGMALAKQIRQERMETVLQSSGSLLSGARKTRVRNGVAIMEVSGPIFPKANLFTEVSEGSSIEMMAKEHALAMTDRDVHHLILDIHSPGGDVVGVNEFANLVYEYRKVKPTTAYVRGMAASGGYWIASACEEIYGDATCMVGSIGVIAAMNGKSKYEIISSQSPHKRLDPENPEDVQIMQRRVDAVADVFVKAVARNRGTSVFDVLDNYGQGDILIGVHAARAGMIDGLGSLEEIISIAAENKAKKK